SWPSASRSSPGGRGRQVSGAQCLTALHQGRKDMAPEIAAILSDICGWVRSRPDLGGLALVGSYTTGRARADADIDVTILTDAIAPLRTPTGYKVPSVASAPSQKCTASGSEMSGLCSCGSPTGQRLSLPSLSTRGRTMTHPLRRSV